MAPMAAILDVKMAPFKQIFIYVYHMTWPRGYNYSTKGGVSYTPTHGFSSSFTW